MQIVEQTTDRLLIRHRPPLFSRLFRTLFGTGAGLGLLLWSGPVRLDCQRLEPTQVRCQFSTPGWLGLASWRDRTIHNLQGVTLNANMDDDGAFYQAMLQTDKGDLPLRPYKTSGLDNTRKTVTQIQTFLTDQRSDRLTVVQVDWLQWLGLMAGILFFLPGLRSLYKTLFSLQAKLIESYQFDQTQRRVTYEYGGLLRRSQQQYPFSDIQRLILDVNQLTRASLLLELRSGELLTLSHSTDTMMKQPLRGAEWQTLQPLVADMSRIAHQPWQLAIGYYEKWLHVQIAEYKQAKKRVRWLGIPSAPAAWIFDRSTQTLLHQRDKTVTTYKLRDNADVQVMLAGAPMEKKDSDGDRCYEVSYSLNLVLADRKPLLIQRFSSYDYKWQPDSVKQSAAQEQAEKMAQCIRQYIDRS